MSDVTSERIIAEAEAIMAGLSIENTSANREALREIAAEMLGYQAEIARLKAENAQLRDDVGIVAAGLESAYAYSTGKPERWGPGYEQVRHILHNAFTDLRNALAKPAA